MLLEIQSYDSGEGPSRPKKPFDGVRPRRQATFYFLFIAPKASAEGACILAEMGYCYGVWLVTVVVVCVVTVMV